MTTTSRSLRYHETGAPQSVLRLEEETHPEPADGEIALRMLAAPINPADLNMLEGKYGKSPKLPAVPGMEGVGRIEGDGGLSLIPHGVGSWRERVVVQESDLVRVPGSLDPLQAAMLRVNPPTAFLMLENYVSLEPGDWVVQNAANSAVGRCVIQIAKARGLRTVNVVRRQELIPDLEAEGGDVVILDGREDFATIRERTNGAEIRLGLNAVGGDCALGVAAALSDGGTLVTYGAMARQPVKLPAGLLIFRGLHACGFWVTRWFEQACATEKTKLMENLVALLEKGQLKMPVEAVYGIEEHVAAVTHALKGGRNGKILFRFND